MGFGPAFGALSTGAGLVTTTALTSAAVSQADRILRAKRKRKKERA